MRRLISISGLLVLYILFTAKSCENGQEDVIAREDSLAAAVRDSITSAFSSDALSNQALRAFEETARLKLLDLGDFLGILSDSSTSDVFKTKVGQMISELFISRDVSLQFSSPGCLKKDEPFTKQLRIAGMNHAKWPVGIVFDSVIVKNRLKRANDSLFSGTLRFQIQCKPDVTANPQEMIVGYKIIDIFVVRREKIFGDKSLKVWSVALGDLH